MSLKAVGNIALQADSKFNRREGQLNAPTLSNHNLKKARRNEGLAAPVRGDDLPPHSPEIEKAVLGCLLSSPECLVEGADIQLRSFYLRC